MPRIRSYKKVVNGALIIWCIVLALVAAHRLTARAARIPPQVAETAFGARSTQLIKYGTNERLSTAALLQRSSLLVFVKTTCSACVSDAASIRAMLDDLGANAFIVVLDSSNFAIRRYSKETGIALDRILLPEDSIARSQLSVRFVPTVVLSLNGRMSAWHGLPSKSQMFLQRMLAL